MILIAPHLNVSDNDEDKKAAAGYKLNNGIGKLDSEKGEGEDEDKTSLDFNRGGSVLWWLRR